MPTASFIFLIIFSWDTYLETFHSYPSIPWAVNSNFCYLDLKMAVIRYAFDTIEVNFLCLVGNIVFFYTCLVIIQILMNSDK